MNPRKFADNLEQILDFVSPGADVHMLTTDQRWMLLVEILLGHPPVKGSWRPRDFPQSEQRRLTLAFSSALSRTRAWSYGPPGQGCTTAYRLADWVLAHALIVLAQRWVANDTQYMGAIWTLLNGCCTGIANNGDEGAAQAVTHAMTALGFNANECNIAIGLAGSNVSHQRQRAAELAAALAFVAPDEKARKDHARMRDDANSITLLQAIRIQRLQVKTSQMQDFVARCKLHFVMRGASVWGTQALALLRDNVVGGNEGAVRRARRVPLLTVDSDVATHWWLLEGDWGEMPLDERIHAGLLELEGGQLFRRIYPRLKEYVRKAQLAGVPLRTALPAFKFREFESQSLVDLATCVEVYHPGHVDKDSTRIPEMDVVRSPSQAYPECCGRRDDVAIDDRLPPWLQSRKRPAKDPFAPGGPQSFGWAATAFSCVGTSHRTKTSISLAREIRRPDLPGFFTRKELVDALDDSKKGLVSYVWIDGDQIGRKFLEVPPLSRPALSIRFAHELRTRWIRGVKHATEFSKCSVLPVELFFLGGDDLAFLLPRSCIDPFLEGFGGESVGDGVDCEFSLAAMSFEHGADSAAKFRLTEATLRTLHPMLAVVKQLKARGADLTVIRNDFTMIGLASQHGFAMDDCTPRQAPGVTGAELTVSLP